MARARASLRQRLFRLRRSLGFDLLQGSVVASVRPQVQIDLKGSDAGAGELLGPLSEADAGGLAAWLADMRQQRRGNSGRPWPQRSNCLPAMRPPSTQPQGLLGAYFRLIVDAISA